MVAIASLKAIKPHRFKKGHKGGPGNPLGKQTNQLRAALIKAVTPEKVKKIADALIAKAENGDVAATHELFNRLFGKANQPMEVTATVEGKTEVRVTHEFDHARFAKLYFSRTAGIARGTGSDTGNDN